MQLLWYHRFEIFGVVESDYGWNCKYCWLTDSVGVSVERTHSEIVRTFLSPTFAGITRSASMHGSWNEMSRRGARWLLTSIVSEFILRNDDTKNKRPLEGWMITTFLIHFTAEEKKNQSLLFLLKQCFWLQKVFWNLSVTILAVMEDGEDTA